MGEACTADIPVTVGDTIEVAVGVFVFVEVTINVGIAPQANNAGTRFRFSNTAFAQLMYYPHQHRWAIDKLNDHAHWLDAD